MAWVLLHGHTFTSDPIMNPARIIMVSLCQRASSQCRNLEKDMIPTTAPARKTTRMQADVQNVPASAPEPPQRAAMLPVQPVIDSIMYWYFPNMSSMKLPDIPGSTIAHIAIAPLMKMNQSPSGVWVGDRVHMTTPNMMPKMRNSPSRTFHPDIPFNMNMLEAAINPKKNPHV